jgi:predicted AAA+ superfamily ATPase
MHGVSQSLSGRIAVLTLLPFSIAESQKKGDKGINIDKGLKNIYDIEKETKKHKKLSIDDWLLRGAYPEIRVNHEVDRQLWIAGYVQTYLERDVRQVMNVGDLNSFNRFLRLCAARTGQILNMSELGRDVGVSVPTVKKWLSILEASYQIFLLPPHFNNFGKRIIKSPKLYFLDTGIATFLLGLHAKEPLMQGPMWGPVFETMVVSEWIKAFYNSGERPELYYWRSKAGIEIDLIIDRNGRLYPMEIKATSTVMPGHTENLKKWKEFAGDMAAEGLIIADIMEPFEVKGVRAVSWETGLKQI